MGREIQGRARRAAGAADRGRQLPGTREPGRGLHPDRPAQRAHGHAGAPLGGAPPGRPAGGIPRQLHAAGGDAGGPAAPAEVPRHAHHRPERSRLQHRGRELRHRLRPPRARLADPRAVRRAAAPAGPADRRHDRPQHDAAPGPAGAARPGRPGSGGRSPGGRRADRDGPPAHGRRGPGGLPLPRPVPRPGLRRPAASQRGRPARPPHHRAAVRLAGLGHRVHLARRRAPGRAGARRRPGPARQRREDRPGADGVPDRPVGAPAGEPPPRGRRPRLRAGRPDRRPPPGDAPSSSCPPATPRSCRGGPASSSGPSWSSSGSSCWP